MTYLAVADILQAFETCRDAYPRAAVDAALARRQELTPHLIEILKNAAARPAAVPENYGPAFALMLLGHFRETAAHPAIVDVCSLPGNLPGRLFNFILSEYLPTILADTCAGDLALIAGLLRNRDASLVCRSAAARALAYGLAAGALPREEVVAVLGSVFTGDEAEPASPFWGLMAQIVCDIYPEELLPVIRRAFQRDLIDEILIDLGDFQEALQDGPEACLNGVRREMARYSLAALHPIMADWLAYQLEKPEASGLADAPSPPWEMRDAPPHIEEILEALEFSDGVYQQDAVTAAIAHREEIVPHLIDVLEQLAADPDPFLADPDYYLYIYAFMLLGHFRETRAHQAIVDAFSLPDDITEELFGDLITEELSLVLYNTCGGDFDRIKALVLDRQANVYARGAAMEALVYAVAQGLLPRTDVVAFLGSLFTGDEAEPDSPFWGLMAYQALELHPLELMPVLLAAFSAGLLTEVFVDARDLDSALATTAEECLAKVRRRMEDRSVDDLHGRMSRWASFHPDYDRPLSPVEPAAAKRTKKQKKQKKKAAKASRRKNRR